MLWHRQPVQPRPDSSLLYQVKQSFLFAHCTHVVGAICLNDDTNLCSNCYSRIRTQIIQSQYRRLRRHFFINSHVARDECCSTCGTTVIKTRSIDNCISCILTASELLRLLDSTSTHVDDFKYPLVLNVYDRTPMS